MKIYSDLEKYIESKNSGEVEKILKKYDDLKKEKINKMMSKCECKNIRDMLEAYKTVKKRKIQDVNIGTDVEKNIEINSIEKENTNKDNTVSNRNDKDNTVSNRNDKDNNAGDRNDKDNNAGDIVVKKTKKENSDNEKNIIDVYKFDNNEHNKILKAIYQAMINNLKDFEYKKCANISYTITENIIKKQKTNDKTFLRTKIFNLSDKKNPLLCRNVYDGKIEPEKYLDMTNEEMKSEELKNKDKNIIKNSLFDSQVPKIEAETDMFKCGKCKKNRTTYYQLQTRSADEPMTTFVRCVECNNRWKF